MATLDAEQRKIIRLIKAEGRHITDPKTRKRYLLAAVETGLVESGLHNLPGGDADSQGWRQERASLYKNPRNLRASVRRFREEFQQQYSPGEASYDVAGQVQRPAAQYLHRYRDVHGQAAQILGQTGGDGGAGGGTPGTPARYGTIPGVDNSAVRQQAKFAYLAERGRPGALLTLKQSLDAAPDTPSRRVQVRGSRPGSSSSSSPTGSTGPRGNVTVAPTANRPGAPLHHDVIRFVRGVAGRVGDPLTIGTGTNHSRLTINGTESDHYRGEGADVPLTGRKLIRAGRAALIEAGMSPARARKIRGGGFNVGGWQIIFNTDAPGWGNHLTHLHIGRRRA